MTCTLVDILPHKSVAVHVRVTLYSPAQVPFTVVSSKVNVALPQPSVVVGVANAGVAGQAIVVGAGKEEIIGAVVS